MDFEEAYTHADVLGVAPYFGNALGDPKTQDEVAQMTVGQVLDRCAEYIARGNETIARQAELAKQHGLRLVAYEGGQHLVGHGGAENNQPLTELFQAANRHPRMKQLSLPGPEQFSAVRPVPGLPPAAKARSARGESARTANRFATPAGQLRKVYTRNGSLPWLCIFPIS
jgi:hypothetical protein